MMNDPGNMSERDLEKAYRVAYLIAGYIRDTLTVSEHDELDVWITESDHNMLLFEELTDETNLEKTFEWIKRINTQKALEKVQARILAEENSRKPVLKNIWVYVAAASILAILISVVFEYQVKKKNPAPVESNVGKKDFDPGKDRAILTLNDGSVINLDSVANGSFANGSGAAIQKINNGLISYQDNNEKPSAMNYNSLITPRGGQYQLVLSDGTKVWLNAASSLRFPTSFPSHERRVELMGEAYFEVAKDPTRPFRVNILHSSGRGGGGLVEVLGTHFNISAYIEDDTIKTTLLEGSVKVSQNEQAAITITPGQQAEISPKSATIHVTRDIDTSQVIAWKNGLFHFNHTGLQNIMHQLSRWYNVDIDYTGSVAGKSFTGKIRRNAKASEVLAMLEYAGVHFKIEDKKIIVMP
jgi:ferric-dicitrate binding protein FerR (iron transport regulator)